MAAPITTSTQITDPVNVVFQRGVLEISRSNCPYFAGTVPARITQSNGSFTGSWRRYNRVSPATTALTALSGNASFPARDSQAASTSNVQATLGKYGAYFLLNEEVDLINFNSMDAGLMRVLGVQAGETLNQLQGAEEEDNSTALYAGGAASTTAVTKALAKDDLRSARNWLNRNNAMKFSEMMTGSENYATSPIQSSYWAIMHPDVEEDVRLFSGFVGVEAYGNQTMTQPGEFGAVAGFRCITTTDASIDADSGGANSSLRGTTNAAVNVDIYKTVVYGQDAFGSVGLNADHIQSIYKAGDQLPGVQVIRKARGSSGAADPLDELSTVGWKTWHAACVLSETSSNTTSWCRTIYSGATSL